jgi:general secretion pathway protein N
MKQAVRLSIVAFIAFLIVLIARFPARWAAAALPKEITCAQVGGTVWNGSCAQLTARGNAIGDIGWKLQPARVFKGKLSVELALSQPAGTVRGILDLSPSGEIAARDLKATVALDRVMLPQKPPTLRGTLQTDLSALRVEGKVVSTIQGWVEVRGMEQRPGVPLGDYRVTFPGGPGEPVGQVTDLGGPFDVKGALRLTREPGWAIDVNVAARAEAPAQVRRQIEFLGSPDAQGRRPLSLSGTY